MRGRSRTPAFGQGRGQLAARRDPAAFPGVTCSLAGVSRSSRPLPALSPHAVAHAGFSAGPHAPETAGRPAAPRCCPEPRRPRVNGSRSPTSGDPGSPLGCALPDVGFATNFAGQGRGRWPGQGGPRQCPARDQPAGGAEGGGGHRRSYSWIARGSQLGPAPRSLSVTCLTPPQPGPVPFLPFGVPVPPPPAVPGAHVTDGTAPRAGPGFLIGFPLGAYRPSAPPSQVPALPSVPRGERDRELCAPQPPRLRARGPLPLLVPRPGPGPALWGRGRQVPPGTARPRAGRHVTPERPAPEACAPLLAAEARAQRGSSPGTTYLPSHSLRLASWLPPPLSRRRRRLWTPCAASCKTSSWASRRGPLTRWLQVGQAEP